MICEKCKEYRWRECHCKAFTVNDHYGEDYEIYAVDDESAALAYAEKYNEDGDYSLMNDSEVITVNGKKFKISAEPDVHYSATEIGQPK